MTFAVWYNVFFLILTLLSLFSSSVVAQSSYCRAFGKDFSPLSQYDLFGYQSGSSYFYIGRVCGTVGSDSLCANANSMMCQRAGCGTVYNAASWDHRNAIWTAVNPSDLSQGVSLTIETGSPLYCSADRVATFNFICDPYASIAYATTVTENPACHYTMNVYTNIICSSTSTLPPPANCQYSDPNYPGFTFDATPFSTFDITGPDAENDGYTFSLRVCGTLLDQACQLTVSGPGASTAMMCQHSTSSCDPFNAYMVASWNSSVAQWSSIDGGYQLTVPDGSLCGSNPRVAKVSFICDPLVTTLSRSAEFIESPQCTYTGTIYTNLACPPGTPPGSGHRCDGMGYDFSSLTTYDILADDTNGNDYWYAIRLCGIVNQTNCINDQYARGTMVCQQDTFSNSAWGLSTYSPNLATWSWANCPANDWTCGVMLTSRDGERCGNADRVTIIVLKCAPKAVKPVFARVTESPQCTYTVTIYTYLVCQAPSTPVTPPVIQPADNNPIVQSGGVLPVGAYQAAVTPCGFDGYDFSSIAQYTISATDINNGGIVYKIRLCGVVQDDYCLWAASPNSTMFCQHAQPYNPFWVFSAAEWPTLSGSLAAFSNWSYINGQDYAQGVQLTIADGTMCGSSPRVGVIRLVCDASATVPVSAGVHEYPECTYTAIIRTINLCYTQSGNPVGNTSSGLSSSGLVAAIIIPICVALILLTICCVCFLIGGGTGFALGGKKKTYSTESSNVKNPSPYATQPEASQVSNANVELSEAAGEHHTHEEAA